MQNIGSVVATRPARIAGTSRGAAEGPRIWAVGGGKGGTGKTFVVANLALLLAQKGDRVYAVDADLGAPNLHTFLGKKTPDRDLSNFIRKQYSSLADVAVPGGSPNLNLVAGTKDFLYLANLQYARKLKLLRSIRDLPSERVLLDIGGGTDFNSLDFFPIADCGILVTNPDPAAIENTFQFLRCVVLRVLKFSTRNQRIRTLIQSAAEGNSGSEARHSPVRLLRQIRQIDTSIADSLEGSLTRLRPWLILNKVLDEREIQIGNSLADVARKFLNIDVRFAGSIPFDPDVARALRAFRPYFLHCPQNRAASALQDILSRIQTESPA